MTHHSNVKRLVHAQDPVISAVTLEADFPKECISWAAVGDVDVVFARDFANHLLSECDRIDGQRRTFFTLTLSERKEFVNQLHRS